MEKPIRATVLAKAGLTDDDVRDEEAAYFVLETPKGRVTVGISIILNCLIRLTQATMLT